MSVKYFDSYTTKTQLKQIEDLIKKESEHMLQLDQEMIRDIINNDEAIIALDGPKVIGFVKFFINSKEKDTNTKILELGSLVVEEKWRKCGIGKELVKRLVTKIKLRNQKSVLLGVVRKNNKVSYKFLKSIGGKEINKPKSMILYPLELNEDKFYIIDLTNIC